MLAFPALLFFDPPDFLAPPDFFAADFEPADLLGLDFAALREPPLFVRDFPAERPADLPPELFVFAPRDALFELPDAARFEPPAFAADFPEPPFFAADFFEPPLLAAAFFAPPEDFPALGLEDFPPPADRAAALPAMAPIAAPTTAPIGPATLPIRAPVASPAVCFEIGGISMFSDDEPEVALEFSFSSGISVGSLSGRLGWLLFTDTSDDIGFSAVAEMILSPWADEGGNFKAVVSATDQSSFGGNRILSRSTDAPRRRKKSRSSSV